ncbi:MAG: hypothetical protein FJ358_04290 [Thaumarchaeota archaeon]|nr:hypothetical protein [Nitrososphaerota archaeon]
MKTGVIVGIVAFVVVIAAGAFLTMPTGPTATTPAPKTIELETKEFAFQGLGFKEFVCQDKPCGPTIQVQAGETVRIVLKNTGGASHEFMIVPDVKAASEEAKKGMHAEPLFKGAMVEEIKTGQSATITFVAEKAGKYFYACILDVGTKPDTHADRGMYGEFIVEA